MHLAQESNARNVWRSFGLAREIALSSKWETQTFGTVTHMAPGALDAAVLLHVCGWPL